MNKKTTIIIITIAVILSFIYLVNSNLEKEYNSNAFSNATFEMENFIESLKLLNETDPITEPLKTIIYLTEIKSSSHHFASSIYNNDYSSKEFAVGDYISFNWVYLKNMDDMILDEKQLALIRSEIIEANEFLIAYYPHLAEYDYFEFLYKKIESNVVSCPNNEITKMYKNRSIPDNQTIK